MKVLIFNGSFERKENSTSHRIANFFKEALEQKQHEVTVFNLGNADIPILDVENWEAPESVVAMNKAFREADAHIWLTPMYHGSMTGAMKNCLDWLELSAKEPEPYLTNKVVGMVCWADGGQAMQGINAMDSVAKALRAWTLPYCIPAVRRLLTDPETNEFTEEYQNKFNLMAQLLSSTSVPQYSFA
ncbi:NADPH-dependent FMN reductase [Mangrovibacterium diazotrophicum]|uniref:Arsenic resistance protein ArsH n=1 Tax=Mangrovibacterium diazotrophicum TaxID=1261403 RepID=A0A419WB12_9BACT|nr:NADPH-dependent FMN reductase [Mangrovibacterium diazotrophicum]RKD92602.1 arsenic resistance protein ArsH [Mangrovibacterium diazotrophicum]